MIIVKCIKSSNGLILNQCYEVNDHRFERNNTNSHIDIYDEDGKIDNTMSIKVNSLEDNYISNEWYSVDCFETIEENRNNKLNKLGI